MWNFLVNMIQFYQNQMTKTKILKSSDKIVLSVIVHTFYVIDIKGFVIKIVLNEKSFEEGTFKYCIRILKHIFSMFSFSMRVKNLDFFIIIVLE